MGLGGVGCVRGLHDPDAGGVEPALTGDEPTRGQEAVGGGGSEVFSPRTRRQKPGEGSVSGYRRSVHPTAHRPPRHGFRRRANPPAHGAGGLARRRPVQRRRDRRRPSRPRAREPERGSGHEHQPHQRVHSPRLGEPEEVLPGEEQEQVVEGDARVREPLEPQHVEPQDDAVDRRDSPRGVVLAQVAGEVEEVPVAGPPAPRGSREGEDPRASTPPSSAPSASEVRGPDQDTPRTIAVPNPLRNSPAGLTGGELHFAARTFTFPEGSDLSNGSLNPGIFHIK